MRSLERNMKAISPVLAVLMMIAVAIAGSLITYSWVMGYIGFSTEKAGQAIMIQSIAYNETAEILKVYVQNVGEGTVQLEEDSSLYVNDALTQCIIDLDDGVVPEKATATLTVSPITLPAGNKVTVKVTTTLGTFTEKSTYPTSTTITDGGPPPDVTFVQSEVTGFGTDPTATWDAQPIEGNLLVAISGTRVTYNDPEITSAGWTRHYVYDEYNTDGSHRRVVAIWSKIADAAESDTVDFDWNGDGPAFVILQEFTGAASWAFVAADGSDNGDSGGSTSVVIPPTISAGGNDNILAIPGMTFRGEVPTVTFTSENIDNVIKNTMDTDNDGISGWTYTTAGDMDWGTTATWTGTREASGLLALFSCS